MSEKQENPAFGKLGKAITAFRKPTMTVGKASRCLFWGFWTVARTVVHIFVLVGTISFTGIPVRCTGTEISAIYLLKLLALSEIR